MKLKEKLTNDILMMMAGNFDRWEPNAPSNVSEAMVRGAHLTAQGIAEKLVRSLRQHSGELTQQAWRKMVEDATSDAFIQVGDTGPLVKLGQTSGFAATVADCTALTVAPGGSAWAKAMLKKMEQLQRDYLKQLGVPSGQIEAVVGQWRSLRKAAPSEVLS